MTEAADLAASAVTVFRRTARPGARPVKVVSERHGHASATITLNVYQSVLPGMQRDAA